MNAVAVRPVEHEVAQRAGEEQCREPARVLSSRPLACAPPPQERDDRPQQDRSEHRNHHGVGIAAMVQHVAESVAANPGVEEICVRQVGGDHRCDRGGRAKARRGLRVRAARAKPGHRLGEQQPGNRVGDVVHGPNESLGVSRRKRPAPRQPVAWHEMPGSCQGLAPPSNALSAIRPVNRHRAGTSALAESSPRGAAGISSGPRAPARIAGRSG